MLAHELVELLNDLARRRDPVDSREAESISAFREAVTQLDEPCSESADPTHVTASAIVIGPEGLLLHRHKRLGIWLQPGGHIDQGEHPAEASFREAFEETGLQVQHFTYRGQPHLIHVDVHPGPRGHTHLDLRYLFWAEGQPNPGVGESPYVRWFSWPEALTLQEPGTVGFISALMNRSFRAATIDDGEAETRRRLDILDRLME